MPRTYKMNTPQVGGWHSEVEEAVEEGTHLQTLRRHRARGAGNPEWIKHNRRILYRDGSAMRHMERLLAARLEDAVPRPRGRPWGARRAAG
jgi:hypothetical protein